MRSGPADVGAIEALAADASPAVLGQPDAIIFIDSVLQASVDHFGNVIVKRA